MEKVVIVGSGPAGYTAAIYASRANLNPLVITGKVQGGLLTQTSEVENFPGFPEGINGFELMFNMQKQAEKFGAKLINSEVLSVEFNNETKIHKVNLSTGETIESQAVIIATGASPRWLGLESEERLKNKGVSACATCDGAFYRGADVAVVGGGDTALEEALFLTRFANKVYLIHRRDQFRGSKIMSDRVKANEKIEIIWDTVVEDVLGEDAVNGLKIKNVKTDELSEIKVEGFFVALGHVPNTKIFSELNKDENGYFLIKGPGTYTNIDGVFVAGDNSDTQYRQAITAAGMGCKAAIDAERYLEAMDS
jgi:thioredoxin reductase (NADPH)